MHPEAAPDLPRGPCRPSREQSDRADHKRYEDDVADFHHSPLRPTIQHAEQSMYADNAQMRTSKPASDRVAAAQPADQPQRRRELSGIIEERLI
jgi:hypothetical protein